MQTPVHSKPATSSSLTPSAYSCIPLCSTGPQRVASCINCNMGIPHCAPIWQQASSQWMPWPPHWAHQSLASASLWTRERVVSCYLASVMNQCGPESPLNFTIQWDETIPFPMRSEAQSWGEDPFPKSTLPLVISLSPRVPFRVHSAFFRYFSTKV